MDDLASFANAPIGIRLQQQRLIAEADVVFTGGRSLHRLVSMHRRRGCHLYPSGVDRSHYAASMKLRRPHGRPVAGYVGVLDERIDLELLGALAAELPDWTLRMVGPVCKIDPADLPTGGNLEYPGQVSYADLPAVMAGFDVALMPFALNDATRAISPTKTLEYLAAGLPVVSTRVPDVVADYGDIVCLGSNAANFARFCRQLAQQGPEDRDQRLRRLEPRQEWDVIAAEMAALIRGVPGARGNLTLSEEVTA
jgi:glycosyltransferase involved in cell wall biosynthesis